MKIIRKPDNNDNEPISVGPFLFKLVHNWPLFIILALLSVICSWVYLQVKTPLYKTTARVLFKDDKNDSQDPKSMQSLDIISPKRTVDNEMEVIQSTRLINNVVNDLGLYAPVYKKSKIKSTLAYTSSPIAVTTNDISTLNYTKAKEVDFSFDGTTVNINNTKYPLNQLVRTPYGNLKFIKNPHSSVQDGKSGMFYFTLMPPQDVVDMISSNLSADMTNKLSSIVDLELKDEDPIRGKEILNNIITNYNLSIDEEKNQLAANTAKFINDRLTTVENDLLRLEHEQQNFRSNKGAIDISTQGKLYLENVSNNDQKVGQINMQLSVLEQIERYVKSKSLSNGIVPSTAGVDDPGLTEMVKNIYETQIEVESLKKTTGANNPMVLASIDKIEKIRPQILENLENQRQMLLASKNNLSSTNQTYSSQLQTMPETEKKLVDINREVNLKSDIYTFLLQKKEATALSFISNGANSKVINPPVSSDSPVVPKGKIIYAGSFLLAFIFGIGIVTAKEKLRPNIRYQTDIENLTRLPVISEIVAKNSKSSAIVIDNTQRTLIAEQFRRLRTTLAFLSEGGPNKRILITSAISGEGKSFVAINLAMSLAMTGKKVVILDFDLTKPSLHTKFNVKNELGITDYLKDDVPVDSIIRKVKEDENLYFISAGILADNPSELITSEKPKILLDYLDTIFDFIIIDVAPVGPISDAYILSPLCDATLYIIRHDYTPRAFVERIDKNNLLNKLHNAAIVFNDVSPKNFSNNGYGYVYDNKDKNGRLNA